MPNSPRIELHPISQRVQAHVDGTLIADSTNKLELRQHGCPLSTGRSAHGSFNDEDMFY
ncbi:hypothetical protein Q8G38_13355 [Halomonas venusta]|uniref:hypothetical protein n=1 Tax=Vreelandella venusta TaxID=44935 RepID=UPI00295E889C|nr:hypothetical protein [Halomonas venusta]MDW0360299.1 hypothetical protein [Halomonas venusta]